MKIDQRKVTRIKIKHRNHHYNCKERIPSHLKNISYQSAIIMIHCKFYVYQYLSEIVLKKKKIISRLKLCFTFVAQMLCPYGWKILKQNPSFEEGRSKYSHVLIRIVPTQWWSWWGKINIFTHIGIYQKIIKIFVPANICQIWRET